MTLEPPATIETTTAEQRRTRVLAAVRAVPPGSTAGYGDIARRAGLPGRARLVARVLAESDEEDLPWHRIVRSSGQIAFPPESAAWKKQCARLRREGVEIVNGRVKAASRVDEDDLDALLWK
ncbi:MAG: MGMT family protein [Lysobacteraceae bacterium]